LTATLYTSQGAVAVMPGVRPSSLRGWRRTCCR
jgi:hypothetical protein